VTRTQADGLVLLAALIWGVAFYFQKIAMNDIGPLLFVGLRGAIAAAVMAPFAMLEARKSPSPRREMLKFAGLAGLVFAASAVVQQYGLITATVTNTGFLTALYVVITPFLVWAISKRAPHIKIWLAAALAFGGAWAIGGGSFGAMSKGDALIAASAFGWSLYMVLSGIAAKHSRPLQFNALVFAAVACLALPLALTFEPVSWPAISAAAPSLLYVGIFSTAVTFALFSLAVRHISTARAAILLSCETLFAALAGFVMLGEHLTFLGWIGATMVFAAVIVTQATKSGPEQDAG
jgi:drug/metabolite transporter (DMT)-like permease